MSQPVSSLVFGATTGAGAQLLRQLDGEIWAVSRYAQAQLPGVRWLRLDADGLQLPPDLRPSVIYSMGPLPQLIEWLRSQCWTPRAVIACSSSSARVKLDSPDAAERAQAQQLQKLETQLAELGVSRGFRVCILRPTLIWGGGRCALSALARLARRWHALPRPAGRGGARAPIHCNDLARAAIAAATVEQDCILALGGAEVLPMSQLLKRVARSVNAWCVPVPGALLRMSQNWARSRGLKFGDGMLARWNHDQDVADAANWAKLAVRPRGFDPQASDWEMT